MRRIRSKSKSGFTLLEVLLATVILVIASTMIMQGFIFVMVLGYNNREFAKSGENNYRLALSEAVAQHATAANQISDMQSMTAGAYSVLQPTLDPPAPGVVDQDLTLVVDLHAYSNNNVPYTVNVSGDTLDDASILSNRFAFFYDFNDLINRPVAEDGTPHVMRYGYVLTGDEDNPRAYGWYCFNSAHCDDEGNPDECQYVAWNQTRVDIPATPEGADPEGAAPEGA